MARSNVQRKPETIAPASRTPPLLPADSDDSLLTQHLQRYLKPDDIAHVMEAYRYSAAAHEGQMRKSGEPYI
jgi:guanosine-3',5'-bis(diphosphate) 3'-pyrophosphohydrolase